MDSVEKTISDVFDVIDSAKKTVSYDAEIMDSSENLSTFIEGADDGSNLLQEEPGDLVNTFSSENQVKSISIFFSY